MGSCRALTGEKGIIMADVKVDDALKKEIEAGKKLAAVGAPETGENAHDATLAGISNFKTDKLKSTTTAEKQVLPSAEDIAAEKAGFVVGLRSWNLQGSAGTS